jgi:hypothetical protein
MEWSSCFVIEEAGDVTFLGGCCFMLAFSGASLGLSPALVDGRWIRRQHNQRGAKQFDAKPPYVLRCDECLVG